MIFMALWKGTEKVILLAQKSQLNIAAAKGL